MNLKPSTLLLGLAILSPTLAFARSKHIELPRCGGHAEVFENRHGVTIKLFDVTNCSNLSVNGKRFKMQQRHGHHYSHVYTWKPAHHQDRLNLLVHSNSSQTEDAIRVRAEDHLHGSHHLPAWSTQRPAPVVTVRDDALIFLDESRNTTWLPSCGGRLHVHTQKQKLIVRLEDSHRCDNVRLAVFNQQPLIMESTRHLNRSTQTWTFHLPRRVIHPGRNSLTFAIQGARHNPGDQVRYYFADQQWFFASGGR